ncbi:hypothetical protein [Tardiphaga sp.]|uniref:hypothetical protein n=1 Tax=Tardiphaga sp. TaxID=1926292 RepID=UPI0037D9ED2A
MKWIDIAPVEFAPMTIQICDGAAGARCRCPFGCRVSGMPVPEEAVRIGPERRRQKIGDGCARQAGF